MFQLSMCHVFFTNGGLVVDNNYHEVTMRKINGVCYYFLLLSPQGNIKYSKKYMVFLTIFYISLFYIKCNFIIVDLTMWL